MNDLADDPVGFFSSSGYASQHLPAGKTEILQLEALRQRFASLRDALPVLRAMAEQCNIDELTTLDAVAPLLFPHTIYKSYPSSLLLQSRFPPLTRWLSRLTTADLSAIGTNDYNGIDDWLGAMDRETDVRVFHSSGTSGSMSFLPRSRAEVEKIFALQKLQFDEFVDPKDERDLRHEHFDVIWPTFASGRSGTHRAAEFFRRYIAGSPERFHALHESALSSDMMFLAGRVQLAAARGEKGTPELSPSLIARRSEFQQLQKNMSEAVSCMLNTLLGALQGKRVVMIGQTLAIHGFAARGIAQGLTRVFAPGSVVLTGGGRKGQVLAQDWEETIRQFTGAENIGLNYGMTELSMIAFRCASGRYHIPPWIIPFVLDPTSGQPLPREGHQIGRAAFFDLAAQTYWGGFVTGDEIELDRRTCACGRTTPNVGTRIERFSEKTGGDDKITCAAAEEAHEAALNLLTSDTR